MWDASYDVRTRKMVVNYTAGFDLDPALLPTVLEPRWLLETRNGRSAVETVESRNTPSQLVEHAWAASLGLGLSPERSGASSIATGVGKWYRVTQETIIDSRRRMHTLCYVKTGMPQWEHLAAGLSLRWPSETISAIQRPRRADFRICRHMNYCP